MYYVATIVVRKQINFESAVLRSERSSCCVLKEEALLHTNPLPNHSTTTLLAAQGQYFEHYFIMLYYHLIHYNRSVSKLHDKA